MGRKLEGQIDCLPFVNCSLDAAKQKEDLQNRPQQLQQETY